MGCGASSLKGEPLNGLSYNDPPPKIHVHSPSLSAADEEFASSQRPSKAKAAKAHAYHDGSGNEAFDNHDHEGLLPATRDPMRYNPPSKKSVASASGTGTRASIGKGAGTVFTAIAGGGTVSARKKSSKISDEDYLKYTGMTREELNTWGDKEVYRKQSAATAVSGGMGIGFAASGGGGF